MEYSLLADYYRNIERVPQRLKKTFMLADLLKKTKKQDLKKIVYLLEGRVFPIWDERRLELAMEGDRFFDLVRTGQASSKLTGFVVGKNEVFPIPQREIDISGITQNSNW